MQFLVSVIDDKTDFATPSKLAAIDAFNDRLRAEGNDLGGLVGSSQPRATTVAGCC
ncbi:MAG: hypothetical protein ACLQK4_09165 [Acidimicrobiales bacterium]|jgi:hypothetical protein